MYLRMKKWLVQEISELIYYNSVFAFKQAIQNIGIILMRSAFMHDLNIKKMIVMVRLYTKINFNVFQMVIEFAALAMCIAQSLAK